MKTIVITDNSRLKVHEMTNRILVTCSPDEGRTLQREFDKLGIRVTGSDNMSRGIHTINLPWPIKEATQREMIHAIIRRCPHEIQIEG